MNFAAVFRFLGACVKQVLTAIVATSLGLGAALAQTAGAPESIGQIVGATPAGDKSTSIINGALGGNFFVEPFSSVGGASTVLGNLLLIFNGSIFLVAVFWGSYNILRGIVSTAHEGQVLGQKMSAVWLPIRMVTGIVGIVPVFGGFNLGQVVLVVCATIGIGIGNMMWIGAITSTGDNFVAAFAADVGHPSLNKDIADGARTMFAAEVCRLAASTEGGLGDGVGAVPFTGGDLIAGIKYGTANRPDLCGSVALFRKGAVRARDLTGALSFRSASVNYDEIAARVHQGYRDAFITLSNRISNLAGAWYQSRLNAQETPGSGVVPVPLGAIDDAVKEFTRLAQDRGTAAVSTTVDKGAITQRVLDQLKTQGWAAAGSWYATFAEVNAAIADAVASVNVTVTPPSAIAESSLQAEARKALARGLASGEAQGAQESTAQGWWQSNMAKISSFGTTPTGEWSFGQAVLEVMIKTVSKDSGGGDQINPIIMFKNLGDYLMGIGQASIAGGKYLDKLNPLNVDEVSSKPTDSGAETGALSKGSFVLRKVGQVLAEVPALLTAVGWALVVIGMLMAIYIPMIPFLTWMGGLVQYVVIVFEGMIAMTLAALSHMEAEGDGLGQRTERGYLFLLNVLARPACMLLGFFAAAALCTALGTFQTQLFVIAVSNAQGNSITGLLTILGMLALFLLLNITLIQGLFNMIFLIPDNVIGMVGSNSNADIGKDTERSISGMFLSFRNRLDVIKQPIAGAARPATSDPSKSTQAGQPGGDKSPPTGSVVRGRKQ